MLQLEFLPDLNELYPRPDAVIGIGSFFTYTQPEDRKLIHDIDVACFWKKRLIGYPKDFEVYMEREGGNFKVLRRPAINQGLPLDLICFNGTCWNRAIINSPHSSPEARKSFYSAILMKTCSSGEELVLEKIKSKVGSNFEDIYEERYRILQLTDFDRFKETKPFKAWKVLKRLSMLSEKRNINGSAEITTELNNLRDQLIMGNDQSLTEKLQDLERRLLELAVGYYRIDGTDLV